MHRERISDDVYVFTSGLYAQVTACAIVTSDGAVVIDTLPFPNETRQVIEYVERRAPIKYVIYTHYHADHTYGGYLFRQAQFIAHELCRELLITRGDAGLKLARVQNPSLVDVQLRLPDIVFTGEMSLRLGGKTFVLTHSPGHTPDGITVYIREDKILFAADTVMPVPYIVDGDAPTMLKSLQILKGMALENVVQGHGEIVLRGEINETINSSINYLNKMQNAVVSALLANQSRDDMLREYDIESCGKTRIALNGLVQQLHAANLIATYDRLSTDKGKLAAAKARAAAFAPEKTVSTSKTKAKATKKPIQVKAKAAKQEAKPKAKPAGSAEKPSRPKAKK
ncbi:Metallo-beta-lactamase type 2 [Thermoflexales bacterium]|nr:Metallo-beta-lactamase type 2 [Thermoflexales bacterium]